MRAFRILTVRRLKQAGGQPEATVIADQEPQNLPIVWVFESRERERVLHKVPKIETFSVRSIELIKICAVVSPSSKGGRDALEDFCLEKYGRFG